MSELDKVRFQNTVAKVFNNYLFFNILKLSALACPNKYTFEELKKDILDVGNTALRYIQQQCDYYDFEALEPGLKEIFEFSEIEERIKEG